MPEKASFVTTMKVWIQLSRVPFHSVGVLPFLLGTVLAWRMDNVFHLPVFLLGIIAVILIMLCTYYTGEYYDIVEDRLSASMERNTFSGGSQVMVKNLLPYEHAKIASYAALGLTVVIGLIIQFRYKTGLLTIPLGIAGIMSGFFYSKMPIRWVKRGVGEILIGFCYGWLPVAVSYYLQTGKIDNLINWISLPIACTIFNVILINEFPDHPADLIAKKSNLVVRFGKERASYLYIFMTVTAWITFFISVMQGISKTALAWYTPVFAVSLFLAVMMGRKGYLNKKMLEVMCGLTITTNLGTGMAYILAVWLKGF
jgi:1,4-dihydroxy-2-naphthoate octaprenyltransferase